MSAYNFVEVQHALLFDFPDLAFAAMKPVIEKNNVVRVQLLYSEYTLGADFVQ